MYLKIIAYANAGLSATGFSKIQVLDAEETPIQFPLNSLISNDFTHNTSDASKLSWMNGAKPSTIPYTNLSKMEFTLKLPKKGVVYTLNLYNWITTSAIVAKVDLLVSYDNSDYYLIGGFDLKTELESLTSVTFLPKYPYRRLVVENPSDSNKPYSLSDNTLIYLPDNSSESMILHGIEQGKEIQLDVPFDKHKHFNDKPVDGASGKVFTHDIGKINTLNIKEVSENKSFITTWYETKMTTNTNPSPFVASSSSQFDESYDPFNAFDGFSNGSSLWATLANAQNNSWIQIDFGNVKKINMIQLAPRNTQYINQTPKNFYVQTSKDSQNWITVGEFDISDWVEFNPKMLQLKFSEARYCKIVHRTTNGGLSACWADILYGLREVN